MKAIIWTKYGPPDVLQYTKVDKPQPKENEILVRNYATTVTAGDCEMRNLQFPLFLSLPMRIYIGFSKPKRIKIPGTELAGEVAAVGKNVTRFQKGDQVFGSTGFKFGTYAEYVRVPEEAADGVLATLPNNMSYEEAVTLPLGGMDALHFLRLGQVNNGDKILINGAAGSIGSYGVQLAKYFGAEVTAVDSTAKLDMLRAIGADHVIDYTQEDFTQNGQSYDVIFDVIGKSPYSRSLRALNKNGRYLLANPKLRQMLRGFWTTKTSSKKVIFQYAGREVKDLLFLKELVEAGQLKPVIDRRYPLEQIVEAHKYVETGQKKGNVVITIPQEHTHS